MLESTREGNVVHVTLNRPERRNALDMDTFIGIDRIIRSLRSDRALRAVVVSGAGPDFCSGLDLKSMMNSQRRVIRLLRKWLPGNANLAQRVSLGWRHVPVPVIFALHGRCWGGGLQIALGGDFRIATQDCSLSVMENRWGLVPDMAGNLALRELVGKDVAMRWAMSAEEISAQDALQHGLLTAIDADPVRAGLRLAAELSERSPDALAAIKKVYHRHWNGSQRALLAAETFAQLAMFRSANQKIAVRRQKGEPDLPYLARK
nr:putative enoyl-CoA hydratase/isomerase YngF [Nerophis lumbriciformis]